MKNAVRTQRIPKDGDMDSMLAIFYFTGKQEDAKLSVDIELEFRALQRRLGRSPNMEDIRKDADLYNKIVDATIGSFRNSNFSIAKKLSGKLKRNSLQFGRGVVTKEDVEFFLARFPRFRREIYPKILAFELSSCDSEGRNAVHPNIIQEMKDHSMQIVILKK